MNRRRARLVLTIGVAVLLVGLGVIGFGSIPQHLIVLAPVPAGSNYFRQIHWDVLAGGTVQGRFTVTAGGPVQILVLDAVNFTDFSVRVPYTAIFTVVGMAGNVSAQVRGLGTYYIVFAHVGSDATPVNTTLDVTLTGTSPTFFFVGLGLVLVGIAAVVVAAREIRAWTRPGVPALWGSPASSPALPTDVDAPDSTAPGPPVGALRVGLVNPGPSEMVVRLRINGVDSTPLQVPSAGRKTAGLYVPLPSKYGAPVTVEAHAESGESARAEVFVRAYDRTTIELRLE